MILRRCETCDLNWVFYGKDCLQCVKCGGKIAYMTPEFFIKNNDRIARSLWQMRQQRKQKKAIDEAAGVVLNFPRKPGG